MRADRLPAQLTRLTQLRAARQVGGSAAYLGRRLLQTLRLDRSPTERPLPRVRLQPALAAPCWALRLAVIALGLGCTAVVSPLEVGWVIAGVISLALLVRPGGSAPAWFAVFLGVALALSPRAPLSARDFLLLAGIPAQVLLAAQLGWVPWRAKVELAVLAGPLRRYLVLQLVAQPVAVLAALLATDNLAVAAVPLLAVLVLAVVAWATVRGLAPGRR